MKFDRQLQPATATSWVVSYGGMTIPGWRTAAILKMDISPYLSEKSSDFHKILYTAADFQLDERHVIKNEKVAFDRLRIRQNVYLIIAVFNHCRRKSACARLISCMTSRNEVLTVFPAQPSHAMSLIDVYWLIGLYDTEVARSQEANSLQSAQLSQRNRAFRMF